MADACGWLALAVGLLLLGGCAPKPRAPALEDGAAYQNSQEGFRFLVPSGWRQRSKAEVPPGKVAKEQMLVEYAGGNAAGPTLLEASLVDLAPDSDLSAFSAQPSHGSEHWDRVGKPEALEINGVSATRYALTGRRGNLAVTKEVVAFRRGERCYFLTGIFPSTDLAAREQVRKTAGSVLWKN